MLKNITVDFRFVISFVKLSGKTLFFPSMMLTLIGSYITTQYAPGLMPVWMAYVTYVR